MRNISLGVVDDHPLMAEAVVSLLSGQFCRVVATGNIAADIVHICSHCSPDVMIVDLSVFGDIYEPIRVALMKSPKTKIITFTAAKGVECAIRALDAGAAGYVLKGSNPRELIQAVESVMRGETYITQAFASQVIAALRNADLRRKAAEALKLSSREEQIIRLLLRGKMNKEIATSLKISEKTVKHYMTILMQKLHARNRLEVVIAAQRFGRASNHHGVATLS